MMGIVWFHVIPRLSTQHKWVWTRNIAINMPQQLHSRFKKRYIIDLFLGCVYILAYAIFFVLLEIWKSMATGGFKIYVKQRKKLIFQSLALKTTLVHMNEMWATRKMIYTCRSFLISFKQSTALSYSSNCPPCHRAWGDLHSV